MLIKLYTVCCKKTFDLLLFVTELKQYMRITMFKYFAESER